MLRFLLSLLVGGLLLLPRALGAPNAPLVTPGAIEGHVHYPACFGPPEDLEICAEALGGGAEACTGELTATRAGFRYRLEVPPGRYLVYATTEEMPGRRAYFSRHVVCGLSVDCRDHTPVPVHVEPGETVTGIDPDDWFGPPEPTPPLPDV